MSRRVFYRDEEAQGFTTYGLLLDTLFRQLKTVGIAGYFPYEYREDMSCDYAELVSFFGEEFGRLAEQEADASNLSILSKHVSLRGILLERYRKDNERYLAARNSLSIGRLKRVEDKNEPSWADLVASAEDEDKQEEAEGAGIQDSDKGQQNSAAMNSFLAAIKGAHAVDDSVAPEYVEEDDEEPVSGYSSEEDWGEDEDPSVLPADEDEEEGEEEGEDDEGYDVLPADDDEEEDPSVLPDDEDEEYSSELPADEDEEEYSSELPEDEDEEDSSVLPEDDDEDDEEYSSELSADEDSDEDTGYSSELPADDDEEDSSILPDDEDDDDEEYSSELPADDDDEEYSYELPADENADEDDGYSSELPEDDDEDYSSELPEDDDEDYSSELPEDDDDDYGVLPDDNDASASFKSAPQPKVYTSPMMSYSAPVSSMVVRPSYARGIPGRETQEAVLDMMNKLANNIKGWFSRL